MEGQVLFLGFAYSGSQPSALHTVSTIILISHYVIYMQGDPHWACAILIVRNLSKALIAEWNRHNHDKEFYSEGSNITGHHVRSAKPEAFGKNRH